MAITKTVKNIDNTTSAPTNWQAADKSDFALIDTLIRGEDREAVYQRIADDDGVDLPQTVRTGYYPKNGPKPTSNRSVKALYYVETADSVTGVTTYDPLIITIALTGPGLSGGVDATGIVGALCNTMSWLLPTTGGVLALDALNVMKFGVVNTLNTMND